MLSGDLKAWCGAVVAAMGVALTGCGGVPQHERDAPGSDNLIVPFWRIGTVYVGMSASEARKQLGAPTKALYADSDPTKGIYIYPSLQVTFEGRDARITDVATSSPSFKTKAGVGTGSGELDVREAFGAPRRRNQVSPTTALLFYPGIQFTVANDRVTFVTVYDR